MDNLENDLDVTPESVYLNRRKILAGLGFLGASNLLNSAAVAQSLAQTTTQILTPKKSAQPAKSNAVAVKYVVNDPDRPITKEELATSYNNYYEFSLDKKDVKKEAAKWKRPEKWKVAISGLVEKPFELDLTEFMKSVALEERVYRFRCVEAWSMVLPWQGFELSKLIERARPNSKAKYLKFKTHLDPNQMPNIKKMPHYPWPYTEGLNMEEAKHPLAFLATGIYNKPLPNQNGAPVRLVVPWKYGFKSIKSIDVIEFTSEEPKSLWQALAPDEYGFYANVNPEVSHPRWSQARETRIDGSFIPKKIPTLKFNGYEKEVAALYAGLDLKKNY